jgi:iron(III) transport system permease protein
VAAGVRPRGARAPLPRLLTAAGGLAAAVAVLPLGYLGVRALEHGPNYALALLADSRTVRLLARSLGLAAVVTAGSLVVGISVAWLVSRTRLPGLRTWAVLAALPLAVPTYVAATMWRSWIPSVEGFGGAALVLTLCCYPYVYLPVAAALDRADPALEEVARGLGRSRTGTFLTVTLRQLRPAAAAGALLVALYVLSDFGAVQILRYDTFTRVIYTSYKSSFDRTPAAVLGCLLVALTIAIVFAESRTRGRAVQYRLGSGAPRPWRLVPLGRWAPLALIWLTGVLVLGVGVPVAVLSYWLAWGSSAVVDLTAAGALASATGSTLFVSALGALVTTALAVPVGVLAARHGSGPGSRLVRLLESATYAGHALPGLVVALSLVFFAVRYAGPLYQRVPLLVVAYAVLFLPAAVGAVRASVAQAPPRLEEVARSLGRSPYAVLREVTLRLAAPGIAAGAALVFLTCMKELPATLLLRPTGMETLATELWSATEVGRYAAAAPYAALLLLAAAVPTFLLSRRSATLDPVGGRGE